MEKFELGKVYRAFCKTRRDRYGDNIIVKIRIVGRRGNEVTVEWYAENGMPYRTRMDAECGGNGEYIRFGDDCTIYTFFNPTQEQEEKNEPKLEYTDKLGEEFVAWFAAHNVKDESGKAPFNKWRAEISRIRWCLVASGKDEKWFALHEQPERWEEFLKMKRARTTKTSEPGTDEAG
jgi:hypothetical protein